MSTGMKRKLKLRKWSCSLVGAPSVPFAVERLAVMFRWMMSPRSTIAAEGLSFRDDSDRMMIDLIVAEVEHAVCRFETDREMQRSERCLRERVPDYTWLAVDASARHKKYLSLKERSKVESVCCLIVASEWSSVLSEWRSRLRTVTQRDDIFDAFSTAVHEVIASRPRTNTLTDVLLNYIRQRPSLNSIRDDSPRSDTAELTSINPRFPLDEFTSNIV